MSFCLLRDPRIESKGLFTTSDIILDLYSKVLCNNFIHSDMQMRNQTSHLIHVGLIDVLWL